MDVVAVRFTALLRKGELSLILDWPGPVMAVPLAQKPFYYQSVGFAREGMGPAGSPPPYSTRRRRADTVSPYPGSGAQSYTFASSSRESQEFP